MKKIISALLFSLLLAIPAMAGNTNSHILTVNELLAPGIEDLTEIKATAFDSQTSKVLEIRNSALADVFTVDRLGNAVGTSFSGSFIFPGSTVNTLALFNGSHTLVSFPNGSNGQVIEMVGGVPVFATPAPPGPPSGTPALNSARGYGILANSAVTGSTGGGSTITGGLGESPGGTVSNFPPSTATFTDLANTAAANAQTSAHSAYTDLSTRSSTTIATELGGQSLVPGVYSAASGTFTLNGTLTLTGSASDIYVFQTASTLITGGVTTPVIALGSVLPANIYWAVGSSATLNMANAGTFYGNVLAQASITVTTGGGDIQGSLIALGAVVTLSDTTTIEVQTLAGVGGITQLSGPVTTPFGSGTQPTTLVITPCGANTFASSLSGSGVLGCTIIPDAALASVFVKANGTVPLSANWNAGAFTITANGVALGSAANRISGLSTIVNTGTLTLPTSTDTLLGRATTDTLTNKSMSGSTNTFTNIPNSALAGGPFLRQDGTTPLTGAWDVGAQPITGVAGLATTHSGVANGVNVSDGSGGGSEVLTYIGTTGDAIVDFFNDAHVDGRAIIGYSNPEGDERFSFQNDFANQELAIYDVGGMGLGQISSTLSSYLLQINAGSTVVTVEGALHVDTGPFTITGEPLTIDAFGDIVTSANIVVSGAGQLFTPTLNVTAVRTVTTTDSASLTADFTLLVDPTGGSFAETLPLCNSFHVGKIYWIKDIGSANVVTVTGAGGTDLIDGANTFVMNTQFQAIQILCSTPGHWYIF